jgi:hypothetical protein
MMIRKIMMSTMPMAKAFSDFLGVLAQARPDGTDFHDLQLDRQCAGTEQDGQILGIFQRLAAGDDCLAACNRFIDDRFRKQVRHRGKCRFCGLRWKP